MVKKYIEVHLMKPKLRKILPKLITDEDDIVDDDDDDDNNDVEDNRNRLQINLKIDDKPLDLIVNNSKRKLDEYGSDDNRYHCVKCGKSYKNKRHLQRHQKEECIDVAPRFRCNVCFSFFRRKYHLSRHIMNKHKE